MFSGVVAGTPGGGLPSRSNVLPPSPETLKSQGKNTPFLGYELAGRVRYTLVGGNVVYES